MIARELLYRISNSCRTAPNLQAAVNDCKQAMYERCISECAHPKKMLIHSADTGKSYWTEVPCGKCYHCRETAQNEWVTRLWHEAEVHSYVYFTTLSYRSYSRYFDVPDVLLDAFWHRDKLNQTNRNCYSPCLIRLEHLQMFLRNLRTDLRSRGLGDKPILYFACGESGKTYARPHFHLILFSDVPLSGRMISRAWSIRKGRKDMKTYSIGNIKHDCLSTNGTLTNKPVELDSKKVSAKYCFKYVAKYVGKSDSFNHSRLKLFVDAFRDFDDFRIKYGEELPYRIFNKRVFKRFCTENMTDYENLLKEFYKIFEDYETTNDEVENTAREVFFRKVFSECRIDKYPEFKCPDDKRSWCKSNGFADKPAEVSPDKNFESALLQTFRPFVTVSRSRGIGSVYLDANIERMVAGNLSLKEAPFGKLVFPRYYLRKISEKVCSFEVYSGSSAESTYYKGNRPQLFENFDQWYRNDFSNFDYPSPELSQVVPGQDNQSSVRLKKKYLKPYKSPKHFGLELLHKSPLRLTDEELKSVLFSEYSARDPLHHCKLLFDVQDDYFVDAAGFEVPFKLLRVTAWSYNRVSRKYENIYAMWFHDWWPMYKEKFEEAKKRADDAIWISQMEYENVLKSRSLLDSLLYDVERYSSDSLSPHELLRDEIKSKQDKEREDMDLKRYQNFNSKIF